MVGCVLVSMKDFDSVTPELRDELGGEDDGEDDSESFDIVNPEQILDGTATDSYFIRTEETLDGLEKNPRVVAEVNADQFSSGEFEMFSGIKDVAKLFEGVPVDVDALHDGQLFDGGPVMRIEGGYRSFARFETSMLGFLSHASGMATNALEVRTASYDTPIVSFGARHVHPSIAAVVERSALQAGLDGFSHVAAGDVLDRDATGTMPHALIISCDDQEQAWVGFNEYADADASRIALADTYSDEVDESIRAAEALGEDLDGVRLDTTSSRRGDFERIIKEVRWELDERGHEHVDIFISGGIGPSTIRDLSDIVDGIGVGSYISNAEPVDFGLDIVMKEGESVAKRGKLSHKKAVSRVNGDHIVERFENVSDESDLLDPLIRDGEIVRDDFSIESASTRALNDARRVNFGTDE